MPPLPSTTSEGIAEYDVGHWSVAREHFASAIKADPNLAESHFNLALALDKLDLHSEATIHFKKAAELAPGNSAITQSSAYRRPHRIPLVILWNRRLWGMGGTRGFNPSFLNLLVGHLGRQRNP